MALVASLVINILKAEMGNNKNHEKTSQGGDMNLVSCHFLLHTQTRFHKGLLEDVPLTGAGGGDQNVRKNSSV